MHSKPDANGNINCINCTNCRNCVNCTNCTNCDGCKDCHACINCTESEGVIGESNMYKDRARLTATLKPVRMRVTCKADIELRGKEYELPVEYDEVINMGTADYTIAFPPDMSEADRKEIQDIIDQIPFEKVIENAG